MNRNNCSVNGCGRNKQKNPTLHFFSFPVTRPHICQAWINNCANDALFSCSEKTLNKKVVCELHFEDDCFLNTMKTRVHTSAIPTIFDPTYDTVVENNQLNNKINPKATQIEFSNDEGEAIEVEVDIDTIQLGKKRKRTPKKFVKQKCHPEHTTMSSVYEEHSHTELSPEQILQTPLHRKLKNVMEHQQTPKLVPLGKKKLTKQIDV